MTNLKYLGLIGNVFHTRDIEAAIEKGRQLVSREPKNYSTIYSQKSVGLDPGFGSSNFGVCITELVDGLVHVLHASEHHRPSFNEMIDITIDLLDMYNITFEGRSRIFVDGANPSFIRALKERYSSTITHVLFNVRLFMIGVSVIDRHFMLCTVRYLRIEMMMSQHHMVCHLYICLHKLPQSCCNTALLHQGLNSQGSHCYVQIVLDRTGSH